MYAKSMRFINERIHSRTLLPAVLGYCTAGHFHPEAVTSRIVPFTDAAQGILDQARSPHGRTAELKHARVRRRRAGVMMRP